MKAIMITLSMLFFAGTAVFSQDIPTRVAALEQTTDGFQKELAAMRAELTTLKNTLNTLAQENETLKEEVVPVGTIQAYGGDKVPEGWKLCDGTELNQSDYPLLFGAIGKAWGGSATKFRLPDLQGRFLRGVSGPSNADPDKTDRNSLYSGGSRGNQVGSYQEDAFERHSHRIVKDKNVIEYYEKSPPAGTSNNVADKWHSDRFKSTETGYHAEETGGSETRPANAYVHFIIKADH